MRNFPRISYRIMNIYHAGAVFRAPRHAIKVINWFSLQPVLFSPLNCESQKDYDERDGDRPEKVSVVGVFDALATSRLNVAPTDIRRKPNLFLMKIISEGLGNVIHFRLAQLVADHVN